MKQGEWHTMPGELQKPHILLIFIAIDRRDGPQHVPRLIQFLQAESSLLYSPVADGLLGVDMMEEKKNTGLWPVNLIPCSAASKLFARFHRILIFASSIFFGISMISLIAGY